MLSLIVGLLGYWMGPDAFGASLINAAESIEILFWIIGVVLGIFLLMVSGVLGIIGVGAGFNAAGKVGAVAGGLVGAGASLLLLMVGMGKVVIMILLCQYIAGSIDPNMVNFDSLGNSQIIAFIVILVLPFLGNTSNKVSETDK